jgi:hypothetical protein
MKYDINFFNSVVTEIQKYYPDMRVAYKDESILMKIIGKILFFNNSFMKDYTTTIGSTVYFPNKQFVEKNTINASIIALHEMMHVSQSKKISPTLFSFLYLFPQILFLIFLPLLLVSWKIFLPLLFLSALPIPAYFRSLFEQEAYSVSLYVSYKMNKLYGLNIDLASSGNFYISQFKGPYYYFMNPFNTINNYFKNILIKINNDQKPFDNIIFDKIDDIFKNIK